MSMAESTGVQDLINRLRDEGVAAGKQEADRLAREARAQAAQLLNSAKAQAEGELTRARAAIAADRAAATEALRLAARDTTLRLESQILSQFGDFVRRLVAEDMRDVRFLRELVLAVAGRAGAQRPDNAPAQVLVSAGAEGMDPDTVKKAEKDLRSLLAGITRDMLKPGIELAVGEGAPGVRVRLKGEDIEMDLTGQAIAELLLQNILPKYQSLLQGD